MYVEEIERCEKAMGSTVKTWVKARCVNLCVNFYWLWKYRRPI